MYRQLGAALASADADASVRAVLLHGTRDCFSAGNDLADFLKPRAAGEESPAAHLFRALPTMKKPVVAAVAGPAGGLRCPPLPPWHPGFPRPRAPLSPPLRSVGPLPAL